MKTLILDASRWICGSPHIVKSKEKNSLGVGQTLLKNKEGFYCCLGQFSKQLSPYITDITLIDLSYPEHMRREIPLLTSKSLKGYIINSQFSKQAMEINDSTTTTIHQKIKELRQLCKNVGYRLKVINLKKTLNKET